MDYKAVKKLWDSWISKKLSNLQESFSNKNFFDFNVGYNGFCLKQIFGKKKKIGTPSFTHGAVIFFYKNWHFFVLHTNWEKKFCFEPIFSQTLKNITCFLTQNNPSISRKLTV